MRGWLILATNGVGWIAYGLRECNWFVALTECKECGFRWPEGITPHQICLCMATKKGLIKINWEIWKGPVGLWSHNHFCYFITLFQVDFLRNHFQSRSHSLSLSRSFVQLTVPLDSANFLLCNSASKYFSAAAFIHPPTASSNSKCSICRNFAFARKALEVPQQTPQHWQVRPKASGNHNQLFLAIGTS